MNGNLKGKVVLITGATGALGSAVTREFARSQAHLALTGRSSEKLTQLTTEIDVPEERIVTMAADITRQEEVDDLVEAVIARFDAVDALLNIAGGWSGGKPVAETPVEKWDHMLDLNLRAAFLLSKAVIPYMARAGWGRIVHISSKTAVKPRAKQAAYAIAKMGVITLTDVIAAEVKDSGITANVVLPSIIDTPDNRKYMPNADPDKWVPPRQIAALLRYLCSHAASSINGAQIPIYGAV